MKRLDCEYHLAPSEGRFHTEIGRWTGPVDLGPEVLAKIRGQLEPEDYGALLFDALFPPGSELHDGYRAVEAHARDREGLRFRLRLDAELDDEVRELTWELLYDRKQDELLACSQWLAFSRSLLANGISPNPARRPSVLVAVADPLDIEQLGEAPIDRKKVERSLITRFRQLWGRITWRLLTGSVTLSSLREKLRTGRFNVLHLISHGASPAWGRPGLILQQENGLAAFADDAALKTALCDSRGLRLLVLGSCHGAAARRQGPHRELAERLAQRGIPAIVAMRREITLEAAKLFAHTFYAALVKNGEVDAAVNEARRQLYLNQKWGHAHWSDPVLFMRGVPWQKSRNLAPWLAAFALGFGLGTGSGLFFCPDPPPCVPCPLCRPCPPPQASVRPTLQVTKVAGQAVSGQTLTVPPLGDVEGILQWPGGEYPVRAAVSDGGNLWESPAGSLGASSVPWTLTGVHFRTPQNLLETKATVTVKAGSSPEVAAASIPIKVDPPTIAIETICGQEGSRFGRGCNPFSLEGKADGVLEEEERLWISVYRWVNGDVLWQRCLYADVGHGRWRAERTVGSIGEGGAYQIRIGLVARQYEGQICPEDLAPLYERTFDMGTKGGAVQ